MRDNLVARVLRVAAKAPLRPVFTFVDDQGRDQVTLTYADLLLRASAISQHLKRSQLAVGDRVLLIYPPGPDFVAALLGTLAAGLVAVPVIPPNPMRPGTDVERLATMAENAGVQHALTVRWYNQARRAGELLGAAGRVLGRTPPRWPSLKWQTTDTVALRDAPPLTAPPVTDESLAILQYTSGSTASPRGVMLTHAHILAHIKMLADGYGMGETSVVVTWGPHFHDMCLVGNILSTLTGAGRLYLMSPLTFIRQPHLWLSTISRVRGTHTAAPNFALDIVVRKSTPEQRSRLDLSSMKVLLNGSEPLSGETQRRFVETFQPAGFPVQALCPSYGLAENTLAVTAWGKDSLHVDRSVLGKSGRIRPLPGTVPHLTKEVVSCGRPLEGVHLVIVHPDTLEICPEDHVGEIWLDSPSKANGYFGMAEMSETTFRAQPANAAEERRYLRTGDLGFLHQGQLYVTGRLKDVLILHGHNYYPQDVERALETSDPSLRPGCSAAFTVESEDGQEALVVLSEVARGFDESKAASLLASLRRTVAAMHFPVPQEALLLAAGSLPKTSSGKIRRSTCRELYLQGRFRPLAVSTAAAFEETAPQEILVGHNPAEAAELIVAYLRDLVGRSAGLLSEQVPVTEPLSVFGLESLRLTELQHHIQRDLGVELSLQSLLEDPSLRDLAEHIARRLDDGAAPEKAGSARDVDEMSEEELDAMLLSLEPEPCHNR